MAPPASGIGGCLTGAAALTTAAGGIGQLIGAAIAFVLRRGEEVCHECGEMKRKSRMKKHVDKHRARDEEKTEAEMAALKAELDRKMAEHTKEMEEKMQKERDAMQRSCLFSNTKEKEHTKEMGGENAEGDELDRKMAALLSVLEYKARCANDWLDQAKEHKKAESESRVDNNNHRTKKGGRRHQKH